MLFQQRTAVWQKRERSNVDAFNTLAIIAFLNILVVPTPWEEDVTADYLLRPIGFMFFAVIDSITVTMHLINSIGGRIVAMWHCHILAHVLFLKISIQLLIINNAILCII